MHSQVPPAPHIAILPVLPSSGCSLGRCRLRVRDLLLLRRREGKYARAKGGRKANEEMMSRKALFLGGKEGESGRTAGGCMGTRLSLFIESVRPPASLLLVSPSLRGLDRAPPFPHFHGWQFPLGAIISRRRKEGHVPRLLPVLPSRGTHFSQYAQLDKNAFFLPSFSVNIRPRKCTLWLLQKWEIAPIRPGPFSKSMYAVAFT